MSAALYVRTSTADADGRAQLHALRKVAAARKLEPLEYIDIGHSGSQASRPALDRMKAAARAGLLDVVVVVALDRLGRNLGELLLLVDELASHGCMVVSLREGVDLTTLGGRLMLQMVGALAEFERGIIRERINSGITRAREKGTRSGKPIGRPTREVDLVKLDRLKREGFSWRKIAQKLHTPRRTLERAWINSQYQPAQKAPPRTAGRSARSKGARH